MAKKKNFFGIEVTKKNRIIGFILTLILGNFFIFKEFPPTWAIVLQVVGFFIWYFFFISNGNKKGKKNKWYRSKGGWAGAIISGVILPIVLVGGFFTFNIGSSNDFQFGGIFKILFFGPALLLENSGIGDLNLLFIIFAWHVFLGFILGYFIENKLVKRR